MAVCCWCVCVCVHVEPRCTTVNYLSYLWGGLSLFVKVRDTHDDNTLFGRHEGHGRHAVLLPALSVSLIRLQRRHCTLQKGSLFVVSFMSCCFWRKLKTELFVVWFDCRRARICDDLSLIVRFEMFVIIIITAEMFLVFCVL